MKKGKKSRWRARLHRLMEEKWGPTKEDRRKSYLWLKDVTGASHVGRCDEPMLHKAIVELETLLGRPNPVIGKPGPSDDTSSYTNLRHIAKPTTAKTRRTDANQRTSQVS